MMIMNFIGSGLIPARAGTTYLWNIFRLCCWAHPRSRGDHEYPGGGWYLDKGSSPLARGPLAGTIRAVVLVGLIPARAGTTDFGVDVSVLNRAHPRSRGDHMLCDHSIR